VSLRSYFTFGVLALVVSFFIVRLIGAPGYTDAFYHYNAAARLASGQGLTEPYLWTYIGAPETLPESGVFPSHLYWMPLTSLASALGMAIFGMNYAAAQVPFILMLAGTALIGFWLGWRFGGSARLAWIAGLLTLFSGFFTRYWGMTDTFAVYALVGSACLVVLGISTKELTAENTERKNRLSPIVAVFVSGILAGLGHLARADGILLLIVGAAVIVWAARRELKNMLLVLAVLVIGYLVIMGGWFARNLNEVGTLLPLGGTQAIWFKSYDDLFDYPPQNNPEIMFADGIGAFLSSRWEALTNNLGTFIAVEGMIVLVPLMLIGLWSQRRDVFLTPFWMYVLGLHLAMTFVFPFPGYRGGLLHSGAALIPFWAALGAVGLDDVVNWIAKRRRNWRGANAKIVFSVALVIYAASFSVWIGSRGIVVAGDPPQFYAHLDELLPDDARVMINDPAMLYYFTGLGGVVIPNEAPSVIPEIAARYAIDYVVIEPQGLPAPMREILESPPSFLSEIALIGDARIYEIELETQSD
jgi:hypothetical protein